MDAEADDNVFGKPVPNHDRFAKKRRRPLAKPAFHGQSKGGFNRHSAVTATLSRAKSLPRLARDAGSATVTLSRPAPKALVRSVIAIWLVAVPWWTALLQFPRVPPYCTTMVQLLQIAYRSALIRHGPDSSQTRKRKRDKDRDDQDDDKQLGEAESGTSARDFIFEIETLDGLRIRS